ncbi:TetR/AcrR family transcriptional regulator [Actinomadura opuntiae]|uniref:TetR/AcrR family transcriptional regulator n=1 Tax=Actinomadura sp. OS1-43 TaxID=604315 RepID=UPI00255AFEB2|nr:TetR/AcrR family transcriptional regulator [Actinomadura sp. OS1-43]MDL4816494.1 TetR/AcrR family transcriptional regulator [Actinomadura sp. OS1-43]
MNAGKPASGVRQRRIRGLDAEQRREQRRRQLLDSALDLFAAHGYHNTSIEQICQNAYVGTKGFYETFDGREDCYIALLRHITEQLQTHMLERLETLPADRDEAERALVEAFTHALIDDPRRALVTFGSAGAISPAVERQRRRNRRWAAEFVESLWNRHGVAAPGPGVHRIAIGLVGGLFDLIADWLLDADPRDPADVEALIGDLGAFYTAVRTGVAARTTQPETPRKHRA